MKKLVLLLVAVLAFGACSFDKTTDPYAQSDNEDASFKNNPHIPVDRNLYVLSGEIVADVASVTRQVDAGGGQIYGYNGYVSGSVNGSRYAGKGYVRLHVQSLTPKANFAGVGDVVILKTTDLKAAALLPGDVVTFKCRAQYESVAAIQTNERFERDAYATWEFDFCRMPTPDIGGK